MYPLCCRPATGRQYRGCILPKGVTHSIVPLKMGKIISRNMLSWLELLISRYCCIYLVVYIIYISLFFFRLAKKSQFIPLQNVVYFITLPFLVRKIFTFYINDVLLSKCPFPRQKVNKVLYLVRGTETSVQAWIEPGVPRSLRFSDFKTIATLRW